MQWLGINCIQILATFNEKFIGKKYCLGPILFSFFNTSAGGNYLAELSESLIYLSKHKHQKYGFYIEIVMVHMR